MNSGRGERTRAALVRAATVRFTDHGFDGTTVADVADDVGVVEGTVFLHFQSKAGLLVAVMEAYYDSLVDEVEEVAGTAPSPSRRLAVLIDHWVTCLRRDWELTSVFAQGGRFHANEQIAEAFVANNRRVTRVLTRTIEELKAAGIIRRDLPTRLLRDAVFGTIEHVELGRRETGNPVAVSGVGTYLLSLILDGARTPTARGPGPGAGADGPTLAELDRKLDQLIDILNPKGRRPPFSPSNTDQGSR